jgi:hypothetical protein
MSLSKRRKVKAKVLLAAAASAAVMTYGACGGNNPVPCPSCNLLMPPCGPDGGPIPCWLPDGGAADGG